MLHKFKRIALNALYIYGKLFCQFILAEQRRPFISAGKTVDKTCGRDEHRTMKVCQETATGKGCQKEVLSMSGNFLLLFFKLIQSVLEGIYIMN